MSSVGPKNPGTSPEIVEGGGILMMQCMQYAYKGAAPKFATSSGHTQVRMSTQEEEEESRMAGESIIQSQDVLVRPSQTNSLSCGACWQLSSHANLREPCESPLTNFIQVWLLVCL